MLVDIYEISSIILYLAAWFWIWRMRNPVYLGAMVGATLVFGFDWIYCTKFFFNVTYNQNLLWIPHLKIFGIQEPLVIPFAYGVAFGPFAVYLTMNKAVLDRIFGHWNYAVVWLLGAVGVMLYEVPVVHLLHIWTYHQRSYYLIYGVPWSDIWLAGNLVMGSYSCLRWMERWADIPQRAGFGLAQESTWKGIIMGGLGPWGAFYVTFVIQLFWYSASQPWIDAGRQF